MADAILTCLSIFAQEDMALRAISAFTAFPATAKWNRSLFTTDSLMAT
jgi:hypothetical protein